MHNYKFLKMIGAKEEGVEEVAWGEEKGELSLGKSCVGEWFRQTFLSTYLCNATASPSAFSAPVRPGVSIVEMSRPTCFPNTFISHVLQNDRLRVKKLPEVN
jgi:hypothetical protein